MNRMQLSSIDLNLLVVFDSLAQTGSVSRAARRAGITPSAMSHALNRLRSLFGDPLYVRAGRGLVPTPRAQRLASSVRELLTGAELLLRERPGFEPATSDRTFTL